MTQTQFDKLPKLDKDAINDWANDLEECCTVFSVSCKRSESGNTLFNIHWDGDKEVLFNSILALLRNDNGLTQLFSRAYLQVLHEQTVAAYDLKDE